MRRATTVGLAVVALATGCGGGSDRLGSRPAAEPGGQAPAAIARAALTDGRLDQAVVARPGHVEVTGRLRRLTAHDALPRSKRHALGAEDNCQDGDLQPAPSNLDEVSAAIFCLMNAMRADNGLPDLGAQDQLAKASLEHSQDMVANRYFAHDSLDGRDVVARLRAVSYIPADGDWVVGENLAWGSGALAAPQALVNAWMNSPPHRENLLSGDYKEVGLGVAYGTPDENNPDGVTVTTDFGTRAIPQPAVTSTSARTHERRRASARARARCRHRHGAARRRCVRAARRHA